MLETPTYNPAVACVALIGTAGEGPHSFEMRDTDPDNESIFLALGRGIHKRIRIPLRIRGLRKNFTRRTIVMRRIFEQSYPLRTHLYPTNPDTGDWVCGNTSWKLFGFVGEKRSSTQQCAPKLQLGQPPMIYGLNPLQDNVQAV